ARRAGSAHWAQRGDGRLHHPEAAHPPAPPGIAAVRDDARRRVLLHARAEGVAMGGRSRPLTHRLRKAYLEVWSASPDTDHQGARACTAQAHAATQTLPEGGTMWTSQGSPLDKQGLQPDGCGSYRRNRLHRRTMCHMAIHAAV